MYVTCSWTSLTLVHSIRSVTTPIVMFLTGGFGTMIVEEPVVVGLISCTVPSASSTWPE